jgi:hypothetical protein
MHFFQMHAIYGVCDRFIFICDRFRTVPQIESELMVQRGVEGKSLTKKLVFPLV